MNWVKLNAKLQSISRVDFYIVVDFQSADVITIEGNLLHFQEVFKNFQKFNLHLMSYYQNYLLIKNLDCRYPSIISRCNKLWLVNQLNEFIYFLWELWQVLKVLPRQNYINLSCKFAHLYLHPCSRLILCVIWWKYILLCCLTQEFYLD